MQNDKNPFMPFVEDFEAEAEAFVIGFPCKRIPCPYKHITHSVQTQMMFP